MSENTLKPQTTLRDYVIKRVLGRGSFGVTYLAERVTEHYAVAIKEYLPVNVALRDRDGTTVSISESSHDARQEFQSGLDKFLEESRTLSGLKSPHIVQVVDTFELNGTAYMVMKYEEGGTLNRYLEAHQEPLKEAQLFAVFTPLLEGLRTIHAKWLLHRDIKPENIYIRKDGSPLLIDFGTARHALSAKRGGMTEYLTPGFAPPEQYDRNADHGPWTDIYAVGATMYYCVTRIKPYEGRYRSGGRDPVISATQAAPAMYNRELLEIIDWMMRPDHHARPQSVEEVLQRLLELQEATPAEEGDLQSADAAGNREKKQRKKTRAAGKTAAGKRAKKTRESPAADTVPEPPETAARSPAPDPGGYGDAASTEVLEPSNNRRGFPMSVNSSWLAIGAAALVVIMAVALLLDRTPTAADPEDTNMAEAPPAAPAPAEAPEPADPSSGSELREPEPTSAEPSDRTAAVEPSRAAPAPEPQAASGDSNESTADAEEARSPAPAAPKPDETTTTADPPDETASKEHESATAAEPSPESADTDAASDASQTMEIALWDSVKNSDNASEIQAYLDQYPGGTFADPARSRLSALESRSLENALEVAVEGPEVVPLNRKTYYTVNSDNAVKARWSIGGFTNGWVQVDPMIDGHQIYIEPIDKSRVGDWFTLVFEVFDETGNSKKVRKRFQIGR